MKNSVLYLGLLCFFMGFSVSAQVRLLVGTYTQNCSSDGIYVFDFNPETADTKLLGKTERVVNPSFLTLSEDRKKVWCVNENGEQSAVSAFAFDFQTGKLNFINSQPTRGADPCHLIHRDGNLITANYSGGSISVFKIDPSGKILPLSQLVQHHGRSLTSRQKSPHVHQVLVKDDYLFATDLGTDRIYKYIFDPKSDREVLTFYDTIPVKTASGPRHMVFSPKGKHAYLLQELDGTLTAYQYRNGFLKRMQETSVNRLDFPGSISAADIHISADNRFLYASNRGDANTISIFSISESTGRLSYIDTVSSLGKGPRNFVLSPDGKFLLIAHQYSNDIVIFERDASTGALTDTGKRIELCSPVCLVFASQP